MSQMSQMTGLLLILFLIFLHPLMLTLLLTLQTLPVILLILNTQENTWMGYMLFLIFLGGLLIVFIYLSALIPNEIFLLSAPMALILVGAIIIANISLMETVKKTSALALPQFSQTHTQTILPLMIMYLLMGLCVVMFVCSHMKSPIKQQSN